MLSGANATIQEKHLNHVNMVKYRECGNEEENKSQSAHINENTFPKPSYSESTEL